MKDFFTDRRPHEGLTYEAYQAAWVETIEQPRAGLDRVQRRYVYYARYNKERSEQVHRAYEVSAKLREAVEKIETPHLWMVLTEDWCGDSAYCLPVIVEAARLNPLIDLRILPRDDNLDIMDQYLTGTSRSIPKLVAFSEVGEERFRWGPRPRQAQRLRERLLAEGLEGGEVTKKLIEWYEDGGWKQVDDELIACLVGQSVGEVEKTFE